MKTKARLFIGTSNVVLPGNKQSFPPAYQSNSRLHYYSTLFNSVEINSSFYKVPQLKTLQNWSIDVTQNFKFTLKFWRDITHTKNLLTDLNNIDSFLNAAEGIVDKKGCILIQFPGKITLDYYNEVEIILSRLTQQDPQNNWCKAIEFRNPSWYVNETLEMMDEYGASIVLHDMPKSKNEIPNTNASFIYVRFHGADGDYRGSYTDEFLHQQYKNIQRWVSTGKDVYVYFNNTMGSAFANAMTLQKMAEADNLL